VVIGNQQAEWLQSNRAPGERRFHVGPGRARTTECDVDVTGEHAVEGGRETTVKARRHVLIRHARPLEYLRSGRAETDDVDDEVATV
jgi:hypothetical protein